MPCAQMELGIAPMGHREGLLRAAIDLRAAQDAGYGTASGGAGCLGVGTYQGSAVCQRPASAGSTCGRRPGGGAWDMEGLWDNNKDIGLAASGPRGVLAAARQRVRILHEMERTQARAAQKRAYALLLVNNCRYYSCSNRQHECGPCMRFASHASLPLCHSESGQARAALKRAHALVQGLDGSWPRSCRPACRELCHKT